MIVHLRGRQHPNGLEPERADGSRISLHVGENEITPEDWATVQGNATCAAAIATGELFVGQRATSEKWSINGGERSRVVR